MDWTTLFTVPEILTVLRSHCNKAMLCVLIQTATGTRDRIYHTSSILSVGKSQHLQLYASELYSPNITSLDITRGMLFSDLIIRQAFRVNMPSFLNLRQLYLRKVSLGEGWADMLSGIHSLTLDRCKSKRRILQLTKLTNLQCLAIYVHQDRSIPQLDMAHMQLTRLTLWHPGIIRAAPKFPITLRRLKLLLHSCTPDIERDIFKLTRLRRLSLHCISSIDRKARIPLAPNLTRLTANYVDAVIPQDKVFDIFSLKLTNQSVSMDNVNLQNLTRLVTIYALFFLDRAYDFCTSLAEYKYSGSFSRNFDALSAYTNLRSLNVLHTNLRSLNVLRASDVPYLPNITKLCGISNVPTDCLDLRVLRMRNVHASILPTLSILTNLKELTFNGNGNALTFPYLPYLAVIKLQADTSSEIHCENLPALRKLSTHRDIKIIGASGLRELRICNGWTQTTIDDIAGYTSLEVLELYEGEAVQDLSGLSALINLNRVKFGENVTRESLLTRGYPQYLIPITQCSW